jgi:Thymidylate synthase complementing protein
MTIEAKIIADSISPDGIRLITFQVRYPKFVHGELMTHRVFSRNASSSRAIPVEKMITEVMREPAMPVHWGANQRGMQASTELEGAARASAMMHWCDARDNAVHVARLLMKLGAHKQLVNRLIEPFCHINVVITATDYENFFALRRHADAQPEIHVLADAMFTARAESVPEPLRPGQWHLPYIEPFDLLPFNVVSTEYQLKAADIDQELINRLIRVSVARCARTSYLTHGGQRPHIEADLDLYDRLAGSVPPHASPCEHQATPDSMTTDGYWNQPNLHGNLRGWIQFRKTLTNEYVMG